MISNSRLSADITVRVPAKVNLQLSVGHRRPDGFHELVTVFQSVSVFDDITARRVAAGAGISLTIAGEGEASLPRDNSNLAWRAAELLSAHAGVAADVAIHLQKGIPVAGGMAGGSADAAGALLACDALWGLGTAREELMNLAAVLGSDVPFGLQGGTAVGTGRGENLTPVLTRGTFHWVFALADRGLSTPEVYAECDRLRGDTPVTAPELSEALMQALASGDARALGRALCNDLQRAAISLRPGLAQLLEVGQEYGALGMLVSGSGPTCAFLVSDEGRALDLTVALTSTGACRTALRATSPTQRMGRSGVEGVS